MPSKVNKNTKNKYLPVGCFPFFWQRCVIGLFISCEIICLGTGWHHQGENSITIRYSAQVKLTISLFHLLLKSYSMSLPLKKKWLTKCNLLERSLKSDAPCTSMNTGSHTAGQRERKGSGIYLPLVSTSATVESMVSKEWLQKYSLQFTDPNLPLLLLAQWIKKKSRGLPRWKIENYLWLSQRGSSRFPLWKFL